MTVKVDNDLDVDALSVEELENIDIDSLDISLDDETTSGGEDEAGTDDDDTTDSTDDEDNDGDDSTSDDDGSDGEDETTDDDDLDETGDDSDGDDTTDDDDTDNTDGDGDADTEDGKGEDDLDDKGDSDKEDPDAGKDDKSDDEVDVTSDKHKAAQYDKLLAPFKANGTEMSVNNIEEALQLMKMGVNYQGKMRGLKPALKIHKMLENNGLLDESKLNYLIDLSKHDKNAVTKLIKESGINPVDVDVNADTEYTPNTYTVSDNQMALNEILTTMSDTPSYETTMDIVKTKLDAASRQIIAESPQLLQVINEHVGSGHYAKIMGEVDKRRALGQLVGMSDLQAYKDVGDTMYPSSPAAPEAANEQAKTVVKPKPRKTESSKLKAKRRAASSSKTPKKATAINEDFDPLNASEEEFDKFMSESNIVL